MKSSIKYCSLFFLLNLISCQASKENNVLVLSDFTKELINLYINDPQNHDAKKRKDEIIIITDSDTTHFFISVFANNSKSYKFCREDLAGEMFYLEHLIRVFGYKNSAFYSIKDTILTQKRCKENLSEYDPDVWQVYFHKDQTFCKMRTFKLTVNEDITAIQSLVKKHFKTTNVCCDSSTIYKYTEVEVAPQFLLGVDSLQNIISSNFKIKWENVQGKVPVVIEILIDKYGNATLNGFVKKSNDTEIDNEALRVAKLVCKYKFLPASHRGEKVLVTYPIAFLRNEMAPL